jgi:hypothetical protein
MTAIRVTPAKRQQVWDVLADGWTYSQWVVGNSRMRAVDAEWPAEDSTIQHSIGVWPAVINDETIVESCPPRRNSYCWPSWAPPGRHASRYAYRTRRTGAGS